MSISINTSSSGLLAGSKRVIINGGYYIQTSECRSRSRGIQHGLERLLMMVDTDAFHNSVSRKESSGDLPQQYAEVLRRTIDWAKDPLAIEHILRVHGSSCTSSIAQAVACFQEQDHLSVATYFVGKYPNNEDVRARFISTIAYQLGLSFPTVREDIENIVAHDPTILSRSVSYQLDTLILQPLAPFLSVPGSVIDAPHHPVVIIVDGCDYLDNYTRTCIVNALLKISQQFPLRVRILLFTKSSARITTSFSSGLEEGSVAEIGFDGERSIGKFIGQIWNKIKNVARRNGRT